MRCDRLNGPFLLLLPSTTTVTFLEIPSLEPLVLGEKHDITFHSSLADRLPEVKIM